MVLPPSLLLLGCLSLSWLLLQSHVLCVAIVSDTVAVGVPFFCVVSVVVVVAVARAVFVSIAFVTAVVERGAEVVAGVGC